MRCGETHIRSKEYYKNYTDEKMFSKLVNNERPITLEINLFDFYDKKSSFLEIETLLPNFELFSIIRTSQNPKNFRTDWCEAIYINKSL